MIQSELLREPIWFNKSRFLANLASGEKSTLEIYKDALSGAATYLDDRFIEGENVRSLIFDRAIFIDSLLREAWSQFNWQVPVSLIAVGGYGRIELHPKSDIDLLILLEEEDDQAFNSVQEFLLFLWDIGLDIGHSVRTIDQCLTITKEDITVASNLFESRHLCGDKELFESLQSKTTVDQMWRSEEFYRAKNKEQEERHAKNSNTEYNLEPNIKTSPGGLRDIQTIAWVTKRHFGVRSLTQLCNSKFMTEEELAILQAGEEFLWKVRYALHMVAKRPEERLLFDYQREIAKILGFEDNDTGLAVEHFMHEYYRVVLSLRELNDILLNSLAELYAEAHEDVVIPINERFRLRNGYVEVTNEDVFKRQPSALLELFVLMGNSQKIHGVSTGTIRLVREHRHLIDDDFRKDPENTRLFIELLNCKYALMQQLRGMKRYNILGRYLPEFGQIIGQMQHDLFHIYTVDAHTLLVVRNIRSFNNEESKGNFPVAYECMKRLPRKDLAYIAGLYHDIAKGRGGDHSTLGAVDAIDFCLRHGLRNRDAKLVAWLVEKHLLMSTVSQKQDINDPDVIHQFALEVQDQTRLDYLYVLTVADINATNPTLWTSWRASLMRHLYHETKRALRRGLENPVDPLELIEERQQNAESELLLKDYKPEHIAHVWRHWNDDYFLRETVEDIVWHTQEVIDHKEFSNLIAIKSGEDPELEGATKIFVRTQNRDNVFAAAVAAMDQMRLSIQDARIYHTEVDNYTVDTFYVLDENNQPIGDDPQTLQAITDKLSEELELLDNYPAIIKRRTPRQLKSFAIPTRASISNNINANSTILEVITPDRPGLLALIGRIFIDFEIQLQNAKIATLGERVEDIFFITDKDGQPLSDPELCERLQKEICSQIDQQVEQQSLTA